MSVITPLQKPGTDVVINKISYYPDVSLLTDKNETMYLPAKRTIDIVLALVGLILLVPLFIITAIFIKLEDPKSSVFFHQVRIGKNEKPFQMYKFRSMVSNAEELLKELLEQNEISGAMFKIKKDPRITRVGKFLRKTSIDELPQLLNVLKGDMSLVGPRPPLQRELLQYSNYDKLRLTVTPGCTGLWQISGRNKLNFSEMMELDLEYICNRSIKLDFLIFLKSFYVIVKNDDAF